MGRYDDHVVKDYMDYAAKWGPKGFLNSQAKTVPIWGLKTGYAMKEGNNLDTSGTEPTNTTGRDAQVISFNTRYATYLGTDPKAQMHEWYDLAEDVWPFYVGGQQFGPPLLQLQDVQWTNHVIDPTGRLLSVDAAITLREWYEGIELDMGWYTPPQTDNSGLLISGGDIFSSGASDQDIIWSFLRMNGFSAAAAAGAMGNWERESGNHPDVTEVGGYGGYGLAQWTNTGSGSAARKTNLINWCNSNGYDFWSLEGQLNFFLYEYSQPYYSQNLGASFKTINDVWTATDRFLTYYEGCTVRNSTVAFDVRLNAANMYYNKYKNYVQVPSTIVSTGGSGGGPQGVTGLTDKQQKVYNSAYWTGPAGNNMCAKWVCDAIDNAGLGWASARMEKASMYDQYCISSNEADLKVGMIAVTRSTPYGDAYIQTCGHIAIYVGDGKFRHNELSIVNESTLDYLRSTYYTSPWRWGWMNNIPLA